MKWIRSFFSVVGGFVAFVAAVLSIDNLLPSSSLTAYISDWRVSAAKVVVPAGFDITPRAIKIITNDTPFPLIPDASILLTEELRVQFTLTGVASHNKVAYYVMDGDDASSVGLGKKIEIPNSNCVLWFYEIFEGDSGASFQMTCQG